MSPEVHKHGRNEMICKEIQVKNQSFPEAEFPVCSLNQEFFLKNNLVSAGMQNNTIGCHSESSKKDFHSGHLSGPNKKFKKSHYTKSASSVSATFLEATGRPVTRVNIILIQASVHKLHFISHDQMPLHKLKHFDCQFQGCP
jgi:hypothetical protein